MRASSSSEIRRRIAGVTPSRISAPRNHTQARAAPVAAEKRSTWRMSSCGPRQKESGRQFTGLPWQGALWAGITQDVSSQTAQT